MLRLTTFGGLALSRDGVALTGAAAQRGRLSLLALLATAGSTGFSRDKLLLYLWPESDEERARHALKQAVYSVRRDLGAEDVIVGTATLSLNPDIITSDVREFEAAIAANDLATATKLYAGPFLDGFHLKDSVEFERWSGESRARYAQMWSTATEKLATDFESRGDWRDAAGCWRSLAAAEPLSGRLAAKLIRALAESGDVGAAMSQFRVHESLLREELGTSPEKEVTALAESIKNGTWQRTPVKVRQPTPVKPTQPPVAVPSLGNTMAMPAMRMPTGATPAAQPVVVEKPRRRRFAIGAAIAVVLLLAIVAAVYQRIDPSTRTFVRTLMSRKPVPVHPRQIVVAPFDNKTGDSTINAVGEQTADWLTRELGEAGFAVVDSRTALIDTKVVEKIPRTFRNPDLNIALAEENGSAYVIVGSLYGTAKRLSADVSVIDVATRQTLKSLGPFYGSRDSSDALILSLLKPTVTYLGQRVDTSAGGATISYASPPSLEAHERLSNAWEHFFRDPRDTASVFASLDTAARLDTTYATPLVIKAYIYDVKAQWPALNEVVKRIQPRAARLSKIERAALDLYEADLRGDVMKRLEISQRLIALSPGSAEMPLLAVVSNLYAGRPATAVQILSTINPDRGINLATPTYWEWSSLAYHEAGNASAEEQSATTGLKRFRQHPPSTYAMVRLLAARNDRGLQEMVDRGVPPSKENDELRDAASDRLDLLLYAGRELRAHGYTAASTSYFAQVRSELATLPATATVAERRRQAHAFYDAGDYARAKDAFAALLTRDTLDIEAEGRIATAAAHLGDSATARKIDNHLKTMKRPYLMGQAVRWRASIAAAQGRPADAFGLLELAVRQGLRFMDTPLNLTIHTDADFAPLLPTPGYKALLQNLAEAR